MHFSDSRRLLSTLSRLVSSALVEADSVALAGFGASVAGIIITICGLDVGDWKPANSLNRRQRGCNSRAMGTRTGSESTTTASGTMNSFNISAFTASNIGILARNSVAMAATTDFTRPNLAVLPVFSRSVSILLVSGDGHEIDVAEIE